MRKELLFGVGYLCCCLVVRAGSSTEDSDSSTDCVDLVTLLDTSSAYSKQSVPNKVRSGDKSKRLPRVAQKNAAQQKSVRTFGVNRNVFTGKCYCGKLDAVLRIVDMSGKLTGKLPELALFHQRGLDTSGVQKVTVEAVSVFKRDRRRIREELMCLHCYDTMSRSPLFPSMFEKSAGGGALRMVVFDIRPDAEEEQEPKGTGSTRSESSGRKRVIDVLCNGTDGNAEAERSNGKGEEFLYEHSSFDNTMTFIPITDPRQFNGALQNGSSGNLQKRMQAQRIGPIISGRVKTFFLLNISVYLRLRDAANNITSNLDIKDLRGHVGVGARAVPLGSDLKEFNAVMAHAAAVEPLNDSLHSVVNGAGSVPVFNEANGATESCADVGTKEDAELKASPEMGVARNIHTGELPVVTNGTSVFVSEDLGNSTSPLLITECEENDQPGNQSMTTDIYESLFNGDLSSEEDLGNEENPPLSVDSTVVTEKVAAVQNAMVSGCGENEHPLNGHLLNEADNVVEDQESKVVGATETRGLEGGYNGVNGHADKLSIAFEEGSDESQRESKAPSAFSDNNAASVGSKSDASLHISADTADTGKEMSVSQNGVENSRIGDDSLGATSVDDAEEDISYDDSESLSLTTVIKCDSDLIHSGKSDLQSGDIDGGVTDTSDDEFKEEDSLETVGVNEINKLSVQRVGDINDTIANMFDDDTSDDEFQGKELSETPTVNEVNKSSDLKTRGINGVIADTPDNEFQGKELSETPTVNEADKPADQKTKDINGVVADTPNDNMPDNKLGEGESLKTPTVNGADKPADLKARDINSDIADTSNDNISTKKLKKEEEESVETVVINEASELSVQKMGDISATVVNTSDNEHKEEEISENVAATEVGKFSDQRVGDINGVATDTFNDNMSDTKRKEERLSGNVVVNEISGFSDQQVKDSNDVIADTFNGNASDNEPEEEELLEIVVVVNEPSKLSGQKVKDISGIIADTPDNGLEEEETLETLNDASKLSEQETRDSNGVAGMFNEKPMEEDSSETGNEASNPFGQKPADRSKVGEEGDLLRTGIHGSSVKLENVENRAGSGAKGGIIGNGDTNEDEHIGTSQDQDQESDVSPSLSTDPIEEISGELNEHCAIKDDNGSAKTESNSNKDSGKSAEAGQSGASLGTSGSEGSTTVIANNGSVIEPSFEEATTLTHRLASLLDKEQVTTDTQVAKSIVGISKVKTSDPTSGIERLSEQQSSAGPELSGQEAILSLSTPSSLCTPDSNGIEESLKDAGCNGATSSVAPNSVDDTSPPVIRGNTKGDLLINQNFIDKEKDLSEGSHIPDGQKDSGEPTLDNKRHAQRCKSESSIDSDDVHRAICGSVSYPPYKPSRSLYNTDASSSSSLSDCGSAFPEAEEIAEDTINWLLDEVSHTHKGAADAAGMAKLINQLSLGKHIIGGDEELEADDTNGNDVVHNGGKRTRGIKMPSSRRPRGRSDAKPPHRNDRNSIYRVRRYKILEDGALGDSETSGSEVFFNSSSECTTPNGSCDDLSQTVVDWEVSSDASPTYLRNDSENTFRYNYIGNPGDELPNNKGGSEHAEDLSRETPECADHEDEAQADASHSIPSLVEDEGYEGTKTPPKDGIGEDIGQVTNEPLHKSRISVSSNERCSGYDSDPSVHTISANTDSDQGHSTTPSDYNTDDDITDAMGRQLEEFSLDTGVKSRCGSGGEDASASAGSGSEGEEPSLGNQKKLTLKAPEGPKDKGPQVHDLEVNPTTKPDLSFTDVITNTHTCTNEGTRLQGEEAGPLEITQPITCIAAQDTNCGLHSTEESSKYQGRADQLRIHEVSHIENDNQKTELTLPLNYQIFKENIPQQLSDSGIALPEVLVDTLLETNGNEDLESSTADDDSSQSLPLTVISRDQSGENDDFLIEQPRDVPSPILGGETDLISNSSLGEGNSSDSGTAVGINTYGIQVTSKPLSSQTSLSGEQTVSVTASADFSKTTVDSNIRNDNQIFNGNYPLPPSIPGYCPYHGTAIPYGTAGSLPYDNSQFARPPCFCARCSAARNMAAFNAARKAAKAFRDADRKLVSRRRKDSDCGADQIQYHLDHGAEPQLSSSEPDGENKKEKEAAPKDDDNQRIRNIGLAIGCGSIVGIGCAVVIYAFVF